MHNKSTKLQVYVLLTEAQNVTFHIFEHITLALYQTLFVLVIQKGSLVCFAIYYKKLAFLKEFYEWFPFQVSISFCVGVWKGSLVVNNYASKDSFF